MADCGGCEDIEGQVRFTLETPSELANPGASGHVDLSVDDNWQIDASDLWGTFVSKGGNESQGLQQVQGQRMHAIEFDYTSVLINRSPKSRLRIGERIFNITTLYDVNERKKTIHVEATEPL